MTPEDFYYRSGLCPRRCWWGQWEEHPTRPNDPYASYPGSFTVRSWTRRGIFDKAAAVLAPYYGSVCLSENEPAPGGGVRGTGRYHGFVRVDSVSDGSRGFRRVEVCPLGAL